LVNLEKKNRLLGRHSSHRLRPHGPEACVVSAHGHRGDPCTNALGVRSMPTGAVTTHSVPTVAQCPMVPQQRRCGGSGGEDTKGRWGTRWAIRMEWGLTMVVVQRWGGRARWSVAAMEGSCSTRPMWRR
jgi:hypothetical protein